MKMPETLRAINGELQKRNVAVTSFDDLHVTPELLRDAERGLFLRLHFSLTSGDYFHVDTAECKELLEQSVTH